MNTNKMNKEELIKKYLNKEASPDEVQQMLELIQQGGIGSIENGIQQHWAKRIEEAVRSGEDMTGISQEVFARIKAEKVAKLKATKSKETGIAQKRTWVRKYPWMTVAASALLLITIGIVLFNLGFSAKKAEKLVWQELNTKKAQRKTIILSDGSKVTLNADSQLKYPQKFGSGLREVYLEGEAYFEVKRDTQHPFIVNTEATSTMVLGTKFNVNAYPDDRISQIALVEGSVEVSYINQDQQKIDALLKPKEALSYAKKQKKGAIQAFDPLATIGWQEDIFVFDDLTLLEVSQRLARHFDVEFRFENENLKKCITHGSIKNKSLEKVLEYFSGLSNIKYEMGSGVILLKGSGC